MRDRRRSKPSGHRQRGTHRLSRPPMGASPTDHRRPAVETTVKRYSGSESICPAPLGRWVCVAMRCCHWDDVAPQCPACFVFDPATSTFFLTSQLPSSINPLHYSTSVSPHRAAWCVSLGVSDKISTSLSLSRYLTMKISISSLLVVALATEVTVAQNWAPGWTSSWFSKAGMLRISHETLIYRKSCAAHGCGLGSW